MTNETALPLSKRMHEAGDRILGAKIVAVSESADGMMEFDFQHKGTDDDSGTILVHVDGVRFHDV